MNFIRLDISSFKSFFFVLIQFICIGIIAFTGKIIPGNRIIFIVIIFFLFIGLWAIAVMKFNFNVAPEIIKGTNLITSGPYKLIRHPMYSSVLGITAGWLIDEFSYFRILIWLILFIDLIFKMQYEEKILTNTFHDYYIYKNKTKKIIPYIF